MAEQKPYQFKKSDDPKWAYRVIERASGETLGYLRFIVKWPGVEEYWLCDKWQEVRRDGWSNPHEVIFWTRDEAAQRLMADKEQAR